MKSSVSIKAHPLHPMLIALPVAFFAGTFIFDILSLVLEDNDLFRTAYFMHISGILGGLMAAIPGAIDYFRTVPPESSGKKRAGIHGLLNVINIIIFGAAWMMKENASNMYAIIGLEGVGLIIMSIAGWMGGTLVYRNQIAVDHRYANAGKWNEEYKKADNGEVDAAAKDELEVNQMKLIIMDDKRIVLSKTESGYKAFDDRCTHRGASLADGVMICGTVQCPWHGSQFDVNTGNVKAGPAKDGIRTYEVNERDGRIIISL